MEYQQKDWWMEIPIEGLTDGVPAEGLTDGVPTEGLTDGVPAEGLTDGVPFQHRQASFLSSICISK